MLLDSVDFKDIQHQILRPGEYIEIRKKATLKSKVNVRISSDKPVIVNMAGPHVEKAEVQGAKEYSFTVEPDTEFYIGVQNKKGFFGQPADVVVEVEMLVSRKAREVSNKIKNMLSMLQEDPAFIEILEENIRELLMEVAEIWDHLGNESRALIKELISLSKKLKSQT